MSLWIFQVLIDVLMINVALMWIVNRKRSKFLEAQVDRLEKEIDVLKAQFKSKNPLSAGSSSHLSSPSHNSSAVGFFKAATTSTSSTLSEPSVNSSSAPTQKVANDWSLDTPPVVNSAASSLVEKTAPSKSLLKTDPTEAFDRASQMLARGVNVKEISRVTGLSFAELQLMNKIASRTQ